jgi:formamidopyrimidine-DNA glycosylase
MIDTTKVYIFCGGSWVKMPELPEVETVVRQLRSKVVNTTIIDVHVIADNVVDKNIKSILPVKIIAIHRKGKFIIIKLNDGYNLLAQLRMTGHFYHTKNLKDARKYLTGYLELNDQSYLTYNSIRKFGSVKLLTDHELEDKLSSLGPEPLEINGKNFLEIISAFPHSNIKSKLLDQKTIAGIGNIYAQEALYYAKINPTKKIHQISGQSLLLLHQEIQRILKLAIHHNGSTVDNYSNLDGKGDFQNFLAVYNQPHCPLKHPLEKINIGGRGTSYCPRCQDGA